MSEQEIRAMSDEAIRDWMDLAFNTLLDKVTENHDLIRAIQAEAARRIRERKDWMPKPTVEVVQLWEEDVGSGFNEDDQSIWSVKVNAVLLQSLDPQTLYSATHIANDLRTALGIEPLENIEQLGGDDE